MPVDQNNRLGANGDGKGYGMKRRECLKFCMAALSNVVVSRLGYAQALTEGGDIKRQLRFTLTLTNPKSYRLVDQTLWLYMPATETPTQKLDSIKVSMPFKQQTDPLGHSIIELTFPQIAPLATKIITVTADVTLKTEPKLEPLITPQAWLTTERYIETADPGIQTLAKSLKQAQNSDTAQAIFEWVKQHLNDSSYVADDRGAAYALDKRKGDCTEHAYLAVALARATGIPARMVGGYDINNNAVLKASDYHNWAELYFNGTWRLLDTQKERWLIPTEHYVAFRYYRDTAVNPIGLAHRYRVEGELEVGF
jgi:Transglutaminase-like superfamily